MNKLVINKRRKLYKFKETTTFPLFSPFTRTEESKHIRLTFEEFSEIKDTRKYFEEGEIYIVDGDEICIVEIKEDVDNKCKIYIAELVENIEDEKTKESLLQARYDETQYHLDKQKTRIENHSQTHVEHLRRISDLEFKSRNLAKEIEEQELYFIKIPLTVAFIISIITTVLINLLF